MGEKIADIILMTGFAAVIFPFAVVIMLLAYQIYVGGLC